MRLFLDTSVLLAACGSSTGSSHAVISAAAEQGWTLVCSPWVVGEVTRNLSKLPVAATSRWVNVRSQLDLAEDIVTLDRIVVFPIGKDRPVLLTALASAQVLLTLDRADFVGFLGRRFYGLPILAPSEFLIAERKAGRLR